MSLDGKAITLSTSDHVFLYVFRFVTFEFTTEDKSLDYISNMGNNLVPYLIAIGEKTKNVKIYEHFVYCPTCLLVKFLAWGP